MQRPFLLFVCAAVLSSFAPAPALQAGEAASAKLYGLRSGKPTVAGSRAVVRRGIAYAPEKAPPEVKRAIWAVNRIIRKPYKWGGGHASFHDSGYDCSGTVSYALHHAGLLKSPMPSRGFLKWGRKGRGRWITVYARNGHTFAIIAGLRLDTTGRHSREGPRWHTSSRSARGYKPRHYSGL